MHGWICSQPLSPPTTDDRSPYYRDQFWQLDGYQNEKKRRSKEADGHVPRTRSAPEKPTLRAEHLLHQRAFPCNYTHSMAIMATGKAVSVAAFVRQFARAWMGPRGGVHSGPRGKKNDIFHPPRRIGKTSIAFLTTVICKHEN